MIRKIPITSNTSVYCLLGDPVQNSISPIIHNTLFNYFNYDGIYLTFNIKNIKSAIISIRELNIMGCSVTIPYKIAIMDYLDHIDQTAAEIGAVNTIINKNGSLFGYNFDYHGAVASILELNEIKDKTFVILGAGGAARAIGYGIKKHGGILKIVNRSEKSGRSLASSLNSDFCNVPDLFKLQPDVIINATSIGMAPKKYFMPVPESILNSSMTVMDIVYSPVETMLLQKARNVGCKIINGLKMLAYQGAKQFECWTNFKAPVDLIEKTISNYIKNK